MDICFFPKSLLSRIRSDSIDKLTLNLLLSNLTLLVLALLGPVLVPLLDAVPHFCLFQELLRFPCPGCGITRSFSYMAAGDVERSLSANPAGLVLGIGLFAQIGCQSLAITGLVPAQRTLRGARTISAVVFSALVFVWLSRAIIFGG